MNRWNLTNKAKDKSGPCVQAFLRLIDGGEADELREVDLSDSDFNPYTLCEYMKELGYEMGTQDDNGWELDFWIPFRRDGHTPVEVFGTGITFTLGLRELDYDWKEKERINERSMSALCNEVMQNLHQVNQLLEEGTKG